MAVVGGLGGNAKQVLVKKISSNRSADDSSDEELEQDLPARKVIILGDSQTGKTSILVRFDQNKFCGSGIAATVGVGYATKIVDVDGDKVRLQIWDTAGQERFRSITRSYYRDTEALILVYDVTNRNSFEGIRGWLAEIEEHTTSNVQLVLVANKSDMHEKRQVTTDDGKSIAQDVGAAFYETSAKTGDGIQELFISLARHFKRTAMKSNGNRTTKLHSTDENGESSQLCGC